MRSLRNASPIIVLLAVFGTGCVDDAAPVGTSDSSEETGVVSSPDTTSGATPRSTQNTTIPPGCQNLVPPAYWPRTNSPMGYNTYGYGLGWPNAAYASVGYAGFAPYGYGYGGSSDGIPISTGASGYGFGWPNSGWAVAGPGPINTGARGLFQSPYYSLGQYAPYGYYPPVPDGGCPLIPSPDAGAPAH